MLSSKIVSRAAFARSYATSSVSGVSNIKFTTTEAAGELSSLAVVVKTGSRFGKPGYSHLLSKFNFLNSQSKSGLRTKRESELLGGIYTSNVTRDAIVLRADFLKQDLPYFASVIGETLAKPAFRPHELVETVLPAAALEYATAAASNTFKASELLHEISFRSGLGGPLYFDGISAVSIEEIQEFAKESYAKSNIEIFGFNTVADDLKNFFDYSALEELPAGSFSHTQNTFVGKESRIRAVGTNVAAIGIPIKPAEFGKYQLLSAALGDASLPSFATALGKLQGVNASSKLLQYQDAGLFTVVVEGKDASNVAVAIKQAVNLLKSTTDLSAHKEIAKLSAGLQSGFDKSVELNLDDTKFKLDKFNYVAVGDDSLLPYADEL